MKLAELHERLTIMLIKDLSLSKAEVWVSSEGQEHHLNDIEMITTGCSQHVVLTD